MELMSNNNVCNYIDVKVIDVSRVKFFIPECFEHTMVSYGETIGVDFKKAFFNSWNFNLEINDISKDNKIGNYINVNDNIEDTYYEYNGIKLTKVFENNIEQLIHIIEKNLKNYKPTVIHLDTYYSYWGLLYLKEHTQHIGMAVGIDKTNNKFYIVDPDYSKAPFSVDYNLIEKATNFYYKIEINNDNIDYDYFDLLKLAIRKKSRFYNMFMDIRRYANVFRNYFKPNIEFHNINDIDSVLNSDIIAKIREVVKSRNMFILFLEQINSKFEKVNKAAEYLHISIGKWNTIMNLMFKYCRTNWSEKFNDNAYDIICDIARIEEKAYDILLEVALEESDYKIEKFVKVRKTYNSINLDISKYCNNKGFSYERSMVADLTMTGEYFVLNQYLDRVICDGVSFKTYFEKTYDNIICQGQEINLQINKPLKGIAILSCAEWGECKECITIESCNKEVEVHMIVSNDISDVSNENIICVGYTQDNYGMVINKKAGITYNIINFNINKKINKIILPTCPNMHIISITQLE